MSSLWTPEGERPVRRPGAETGPAPTAPEFDPGPDDLSPEEQAEVEQQLDQLRQELLATPAEIVVANHAFGLFELAAIHLSEQPPRLDQAQIAVDAMGALVERLAGRLGEAEQPLADALAQIRLAFVQIAGVAGLAGNGAGGEPAEGGAETEGESDEAGAEAAG